MRRRQCPTEQLALLDARRSAGTVDNGAHLTKPPLAVAPTTSFSMAACAANSTIDLATSWSSSTTSLQCIYVQGSTRIITFTQQVWRTLYVTFDAHAYGARTSFRVQKQRNGRKRSFICGSVGCLYPAASSTPPAHARRRQSEHGARRRRAPKKKARDGMRHGSFA